MSFVRQGLEQPLCEFSPPPKQGLSWMSWVFSKISLRLAGIPMSPWPLSSSLTPSMQSPSWWFYFAWLQGGFPYPYTSYCSAMVPKEPQCRCVKSFSSACYLSFPELWSHSSAETNGVRFTPPWEKGRWMAESWSTFIVHRILFPSLKDQSPALPVQCLKRAVSCILLRLLVIQVKRTSLVQLFQGLASCSSPANLALYHMNKTELHWDSCACLFMCRLWLFPTTTVELTAAPKAVRLTKP